MALAAGRFVVSKSSFQTGILRPEKQGSNGVMQRPVHVSMSKNNNNNARIARSVAPPVARRPLHAIATNSRVLELEAEHKALKLLPGSEVLEVEQKETVKKEEDATPSGPSILEIHNLLMQVCDETSSIAEVELKVGTFSLRVRREIGKAATAPKSVAQALPVQIKATVDNDPANAVPSAPSKSTKLAKATPSKAADADGGLLFVSSPKVGLFRQGRTVKGKSGPPLCVEGQVVKKGQVVCYLEQLGTQQPVEADIDGEVEHVLCKDGEPIGYGDRLIAIRP